MKLDKWESIDAKKNDNEMYHHPLLRDAIPTSQIYQGSWHDINRFIKEDVWRQTWLNIKLNLQSIKHE